MPKLIETIEWRCVNCGYVNGFMIYSDIKNKAKKDMCGGCDTWYDLNFIKEFMLLED